MQNRSAGGYHTFAPIGGVVSYDRGRFGLLDFPNQSCLLPSETPSRADNLATHWNRHVIVKLLAATFAMIVLPIGSYFATLHTLFKGESNHFSLSYLVESPYTFFLA